MSYGIYKSGQGYWVRVLAASMGGIILLAACAWAWNELEKVGNWIPHPRLTVNLAAPVAGAAKAGDAVDLLGEPDAEGTPVRVGSAVVREWRALPSGGATVEVEKLALEPKHDLSQVKKLTTLGMGTAVSGVVTGTPHGDPLFPPMYIQGAGVGLLLILGAGMTWWLVGIRQPTVEFLIATDGEMKKVNWSTRKDVTASTWVVVMWSVLLAFGLFGVDFVFSQFFKLVGVLQS